MVERWRGSLNVRAIQRLGKSNYLRTAFRAMGPAPTRRQKRRLPCLRRSLTDGRLTSRAYSRCQSPSSTRSLSDPLKVSPSLQQRVGLTASCRKDGAAARTTLHVPGRSEEHTSELQSLRHL